MRWLVAGTQEYVPALGVFFARDGIAVLALLSVIAFVLWVPRGRRLRSGAMLVLTVACAFAASEFLKDLMGRPRPFAALGFLPLIPKDIADPSFPSGHATVAFAFVLPLLQHIPRWVRFALLACAVLIALGRIAVGVHYPTDVVAGVLLSGVVWSVVHAAVHRFWNAKTPTARVDARTGMPGD